MADCHNTTFTSNVKDVALASRTFTNIVRHIIMFSFGCLAPGLHIFLQAEILRLLGIESPVSGNCLEWFGEPTGWTQEYLRDRVGVPWLEDIEQKPFQLGLLTKCRTRPVGRVIR